MTIRKAAGTVKFPERGTEKSSGPPIHLFFSPLYFFCSILSPLDGKHDFGKVPELRWHRPCHTTRGQISFPLSRFKTPRKRALIHGSHAYPWPLALAVGKDTLLLGAPLVVGWAGIQRAVSGQATQCFHSPGSKFMYVTILVPSNGLHFHKWYISATLSKSN